VVLRGGGRVGDTISRGDSNRKKLINFWGKMVKNYFLGKMGLKR